MAKGEIRKESKGRKSEKDSKTKAAPQQSYIAAEVIKKKKKEDW